MTCYVLNSSGIMAIKYSTAKLKPQLAAVLSPASCVLCLSRVASADQFVERAYVRTFPPATPENNAEDPTN